MANYHGLGPLGTVLAWIGNRIYPGDRWRVRDRLGDWFHKQSGKAADRWDRR